MLAVTEVSWAGADFAFAYGDLLDLPDEMALARIAAGLMREPCDADAEKSVIRFPGYAPPVADVQLTLSAGSPLKSRAKGRRNANP